MMIHIGPDHQVRCSPGVSRLWLFQRRARRSFRISARARTTGTPLRRAQPRAPDGATASRSGRADPSSSFATGELFPVFNWRISPVTAVRSRRSDPRARL